MNIDLREGLVEVPGGLPTDAEVHPGLAAFSLAF